MSLQHYIQKFQKLRVDRAHAGFAPHKPILLLSVIECVAHGYIQTNKVFITPELVATFKENWSILASDTFQPRFALPFYHLTSDRFWKLHAKEGYENAVAMRGTMRNFAHLNEAIEYAELPENLFQLLLEKESREILRQVLLDTYFPAQKAAYLSKRGEYLQQIEDKILHLSPSEYKKEIEQALASNDEEEVFSRGGSFKKKVPQIYNYTCAISGMKVTAVADISMIDACHIIPFKISYDDTISNGIALCPNLHRAFDRGLITVDDTYRVVVSNHFVENSDSMFNLRQFSGKRFQLPNNKEFFPALENFAWHRAHRFERWLNPNLSTLS
ncbi:MAG: HNH endonuclease [Chloroherpetonaceae bacterium]